MTTKPKIDVNNPPPEHAGECPRCGLNKLWTTEEFKAFNALDRREDRYICSPCGTEQGIDDYFRNFRIAKEDIPF